MKLFYQLENEENADIHRNVLIFPNYVYNICSTYLENIKQNLRVTHYGII